MKRIDFLICIFLTFVLYYVWQVIPDLVIRSDGFVHMLPTEQYNFWNSPIRLTGIELLASILGAILPPIFGMHLSLYLWFELFIVISIFLVFYIAIRNITRSRGIGLTATLIAGLNYFANWNLLGPSCHCFFQERVVNMLFILPSLILLNSFLVDKSRKKYFASLILFFVGVKLGHVELLLTPIFVFYPFSWFLVGTKKRSLSRAILYSVPFGLASSVVLWLQHFSYGEFGPQIGMTEIFFNPEKYNYFYAMVLQLTVWSQYQPIIANFTQPNLYRFLGLENAENSFGLILLTYTAIFPILYHKYSKFRAILLTCLLSIPAMLFLNYFVKIDEILRVDSSRYLFFPSLMLSVFWAIAMWHFFFKRRKVLKMVGILILVVYFLLNNRLIKDIAKQSSVWSHSTRKIYTYLINNRESVPANSLVVAPKPEFWLQEEAFFTEHLGDGEVVYMSNDRYGKDWRTVIDEYENVYLIEYSESCDCVEETVIK